MAHVLISLASNHEHEKNLREARLRLEHVLSSSVFTSELWTKPVGTAHAPGTNYLNQLVSAETTLDSDHLEAFLKETELAMGRTADMRRQGLVPIDLDLLLHDGRRFHHHDWQRSYIRQLLEIL